jgi:hypothetical protein
VRWLVVKSGYAPSGLHASALLPTLARKLAGRASPPPAAGAIHTFENSRSPIAKYARYFPSGDQATSRRPMKGSRSKVPVATRRSRPEATSTTRISRPSRVNATSLPLGDTRGAASPGPAVRGRSIFFM